MSVYFFAYKYKILNRVRIFSRLSMDLEEKGTKISHKIGSWIRSTWEAHTKRSIFQPTTNRTKKNIHRQSNQRWPKPGSKIVGIHFATTVRAYQMALDARAAAKSRTPGWVVAGARGPACVACGLCGIGLHPHNFWLLVIEFLQCVGTLASRYLHTGEIQWQKALHAWTLSKKICPKISLLLH